MNGAQRICRVLESREIPFIFGLPGSQNAILFSELSRSKVQSIVCTNEMSAGFAALGHAATTFTPGVMAIIGGPGFAYAIAPLMEAKLDSVPLVCMVFAKDGDASKSFKLQQTDYAGVASSICKSVLTVNSASEFAAVFERAWTEASEGEPGPVLMVVESTLLDQRCEAELASPNVAVRQPLAPNTCREIVDHLRGQRTLLYLGRGAAPYSEQVQVLCERLQAAVLTTTSGRGVISELHPRVLKSDLVPCSLVNQFIEGFDRVLALGVRFSENGSRGYGLTFRDGQLLHIDASDGVLGANYSPELAVCADVGDVVDALLQELPAEDDVENASDAAVYVKGCSVDEIANWRHRFSELDTSGESTIQGITPPTATAFFSALGELLPTDAIVVTDSGTHQMLARKHHIVQAAGGLLVPTNFQSMGYGLATAMGAALANRNVVAIVGDGGLQMSGLQLLAAVKLKIPLTIFVFNDGCFGHIRRQQLGYDGSEAGTVLPDLDMAAFCDAIGVRYFDGSEGLAETMQHAITHQGVSLVEVLLDDAARVRRMRTKSRLKRAIKDTLPGSVLRWLGLN